MWVIVCFADPGLAEARAASGGRKVFGINQCGINTAMALRDEDGADVIVLGEGGMSFARDPLEEAIGIPVVDPTAAAVGMAIVAASTYPLPSTT